jgi:large-conductance mechanosensitive channel
MTEHVNNLMKVGNFKDFVIKYTLVATAITWIVGDRILNLVNSFIRTFIEPLLSFDLDKDGKPDLQQIKTLIFGKFPVGEFLLEVLRTVLAMVLIYLFISFFVVKTNLV